jgi:hypothetical protein
MVWAWKRMESAPIAQVNSMIVGVCQLILSKMAYFVILRFNLIQFVAQSARFNLRAAQERSRESFG